MRKLIPVLEAIQLRAEGLLNEKGEQVPVSFKQSHDMSHDYFHTFGNEIQWHDEVGMFSGGNWKSKEDWKKAEREYRVFIRDLNQ